MAAPFPQALEIDAQAYCVLGLATCFVREERDLRPVMVIEPIPSAALEALLKGVATSYHKIAALPLHQVWPGPRLPGAFPPEAQWCEDFGDRLLAAIRTYQRKPALQDVFPLGMVKGDLNHNTERKRILNAVNVVKTEDNVKQHVYTHQVL